MPDLALPLLRWVCCHLASRIPRPWRPRSVVRSALLPRLHERGLRFPRSSLRCLDRDHQKTVLRGSELLDERLSRALRRPLLRGWSGMFRDLLLSDALGIFLL